jgi:PhoH-like ATPase
MRTFANGIAACHASNSSRSLVKKNYILDTNVLLHDPNSILAFKGNSVLIPIEVIEEIDRFKRESSELGQNARTVSRALDALRGKGHLNNGVKLENGGTLRIIFHSRNGDSEFPFGNNTVDSRIVGLALEVHKAEPKVPAILVTKDINLRIKADTLGLPAEDYETDRVLLTDLYTGMVELTVPAEKISRFRVEGELDLNGHGKYFPNEYCTLLEETNPKRTALAKVDLTGTKLIPILDCREGVWGIKPRNREQHFAFDALLDDRVKLVTLMGKAGTGKTLLAMAAGLKRTVLDREFRRSSRGTANGLHGQASSDSSPGSLEEKLESVDAAHSRRARDCLSDLNMGSRPPSQRRPHALGHDRGRGP